MIKPSIHPVRVILALLAAAFAGCAAGITAAPAIIGDVGSVNFDLEYFKALGVIWLYTLPVSLIFGALTHWALLRLKLWPVTAYTFAGMLLGPIALMVWNGVMTMGRGLLTLPDNELIWIGVITGGATALTFRLLVHRLSDAPSSPPAGTRPY